MRHTCDVVGRLGSYSVRGCLRIPSASSRGVLLVDEAAVIHPSHIDHLSSSRSGNILGKALIGESLESRLDHVHFVTRTRSASSKVSNTSSARELKDERLAAIAKA